MKIMALIHNKDHDWSLIKIVIHGMIYNDLIMDHATENKDQELYFMDLRHLKWSIFYDP